MKSLSLLLITLLTLTSCVDFRGNFTANQDLRLIHTTVFGNEKPITVPAGTYSASFGFSSEDKMKLTLKNGGKEIDVKIKLPSNRDFPRNNGRINLPASRTGQQYDITGDIQSVTTYSRTYRESESCTYTDYRTECHVVCDSRGNCRNVCNSVPRTVYGYRNVEYRYRYTDRDLALELTVANSGRLMGSYRGEARESVKDYSFTTPCR